MIKRFECELCRKIFSSGFEMVDHFQSDEHKEKANDSSLGSLIDKFINHVKANISKQDRNDRFDTV